MPSGAQAAQEAAARNEEDSQRRAEQANQMPQFYMANGEFALVKPLATGGATDSHFGFADVHLSARAADKGNVWYPCPTSYDDVQGKCRCLAENIEAQCEPARRVGIFLWVYGKLRQTLPEPRQGQRPLAWPAVQVSDGLLELMYGLNRAGVDVQKGKRYWQAINAPMIWFRGPDYGDAFQKNFYERLTRDSNGHNLTSHPVIISKKQGKTGANGFTSSDWEYEIADPEFNRHAREWPEVSYAVDTPEQRAQQGAYFRALPDIREYFEGRLRWPILDAAQVAPVPQRPALDQAGVEQQMAQRAAVEEQRAPTPLRASQPVEAPDPQNPTPPAGNTERRDDLSRFID